MIDAIGATSADYSAQFKPRSLNYSDAKLVWLLSWAGEANHVIAAKLGTMPSQVNGILSENIYVGSREEAEKMPPRRGNS